MYVAQILIGQYSDCQRAPRVYTCTILFMLYDPHCVIFQRFNGQFLKKALILEEEKKYVFKRAFFHKKIFSRNYYSVYWRECLV